MIKRPTRVPEPTPRHLQYNSPRGYFAYFQVKGPRRDTMGYLRLWRWPLSYELSERVHRLVLGLPRFRFPRYPTIPNGIYFFFEQGETVPLDGEERDRIVHVGTHRAQDRLSIRLAEHFGPLSRMSGSRHASVFRRHVGSAILLATDPYTNRVSGWYGKERARFADLEELVSREMRTTFSFVVIPVQAPHERLQLEAGLIALLAQNPLAPPSVSWLGNFASHSYVRNSGLWNHQHVYDTPLSPEQLRTLEDSVSL